MYLGLKRPVRSNCRPPRRRPPGRINRWGPTWISGKASFFLTIRRPAGPVGCHGREFVKVYQHAARRLWSARLRAGAACRPAGLEEIPRLRFSHVVACFTANRMLGFWSVVAAQKTLSAELLDWTWAALMPPLAIMRPPLCLVLPGGPQGRRINHAAAPSSYQTHVRESRFTPRPGVTQSNIRFPLIRGIGSGN